MCTFTCVGLFRSQRLTIAMSSTDSFELWRSVARGKSDAVFVVGRGATLPAFHMIRNIIRKKVFKRDARERDLLMILEAIR